MGGCEGGWMGGVSGNGARLLGCAVSWAGAGYLLSNCVCCLSFLSQWVAREVDVRHRQRLWNLPTMLPHLGKKG